MTFWLSKPIESQLEALKDQNSAPVDYLIIGSGYGAAMAALAIGENKKEKTSIWVLEKGDEYLPDDFPRTIDDLPAHLNYISDRKAGARTQQVSNQLGLFEIRNGKGISVLSGSGLGGTSLINANVAAEPDSAVLAEWDAALGSKFWSARLNPPIYQKINTLLGAKPAAKGEQFAKYKALVHTASGIGKPAQAGAAAASLAALTINPDDNAGGKQYKHSAWHGPCNNCGNCVIGCHSGAKQSLNMNAWPLARQFGVELFTGATIRALEKAPGNAGHDWIVTGHSSRNERTEFSIRAKQVILAAGTIGSVEILQRSKKAGKLRLSTQLGKRFSANGDALIFSVGEKTPVNALAGRPLASSTHTVQPEASGPTIVGMGRVTLPAAADLPFRSTITLEDGAVPYPLIYLWKEIITTQSFLYRYETSRLSAWHAANKQHDYLAVSTALARHSQILLVMGDDQAAGHLDFPSVDNSSADKNADDDIELNDDVVLPVWPQRDSKSRSSSATANTDYYDFLHTSLSAFNKKNASQPLNGGQYHPNPLWKLLPDEFQAQVQGAETLDSDLVSVHPLGGCCMGGSAATGVVNVRGQVFTGAADDSVHENLYVLDGSIIPGAIGTNPFLTIAAAAYVLASEIAGEQSVTAKAFPELESHRDGEAWLRIPPGNKTPVPEQAELKVAAVFKERFVYHLERSNKAGLPWSPKSGPTIDELRQVLGDKVDLKGTVSLVLDSEIFLRDEQSLDNWLEQPDVTLQARAVLSIDNGGSIHTISDAHLLKITELQGEIILGKLLPAKNSWDSFIRIIKAFLKYRNYRPYDSGLIGRFFEAMKSKSGVWGAIRGLWRTARLHSQWREMRYTYSPLTSSALRLHISGAKTLAYASGEKDLFRALMTIATELRSEDTGKQLHLTWELDAVRITKGPSPLQIIGQLRLLHALTQVGGALAYFARVIMQTHFWSFGAHDYEKYRTRSELDDKNRPDSRLHPPPNAISYGNGQKSAVKEEYYWNGEDFVTEHDKDIKLCRLLRYQPAIPEPARTRKTILLIHGLAHSSRVFWAETIAENFVQFFLRENYDVWIVDHRTSANYVEKVTPEHTWDQIAHEDMPRAVDFIFDTINKHITGRKKQIHVFSHCIGAGAIGIALLSGELATSDKGVRNRNSTWRLNPVLEEPSCKLASIVPHAVTPWLYTSVENRARANVWQMFKELDLFRIVDPLPHRDTGFREIMLDRIATATLNDEEDVQWSTRKCGDYKTDARIKVCWLEKKILRLIDKWDWRGPGFPRAIYQRYTVIWGRQWYKKNVNRKTRKLFASMIGATPIDVMQQVFFSVTSGMLSNHAGNNIYVRSENIEKNWTIPTLFLHGDQNTVFDMASSRTSAHMLTQHRIKARTKAIKFDLEPADYCDEKVWIEILEDYGHMDVIFGEHANEKVCRKLDDFFRAAESIAIGQEETYFSTLKTNHTSADQKEDFKERCGAQVHAAAIKRPLTGPIISHPTSVLDANGNPRSDAIDIRLWCEVQDFTSMPATALVIQEGAAPVTKSGLWNRQWLTGTNPAHKSNAPQTNLDIKALMAKDEFWIREYTFDPQLNEPRYLWISSEPSNNNDTPKTRIKLDWHNLDWLKRIRGDACDAPKNTRLSFLVGSCFYPGTTFDNEQSYGVFEGMYKHVAPPIEGALRGVDHVLLLGDQIYADASANFLDPTTGYEKYRSRYRSAWSSATFPFESSTRKLFSHVPTYFAVDDHEFDDNYQGEHESGQQEDFYSYSVQMAWLYQVHQYDWRSSEKVFFQNFASAGIPFFLFDTRMEREPKSVVHRGDSLALMTHAQISAFELWLQAAPQQQSDILFLASGSPLIPIQKTIQVENDLLRDGDTLASYPGFLQKIIQFLNAHARGKHLCWLSGDPHLSCYAELRLTDEGSETSPKSVSMLHICSSGLYEPFAFINVNKNAIAWNKAVSVQIPGSNIRIDSTGQHLLTDSLQHFVRIDLKANAGAQPSMDILACDAKGEVITAVRTLYWDKVVKQ